VFGLGRLEVFGTYMFVVGSIGERRRGKIFSWQSFPSFIDGIVFVRQSFRLSSSVLTWTFGFDVCDRDCHR
jgi:hypothetical protein